MSVKVEETVDNQPLNLKQKCINCFKGPNTLRTIVTLICVAVVVQQIAICSLKLHNRPITTYTHFDFNQTITYPSVTFCREPPYKHDKLSDYGLYAHPRFTSTWRNFNFSRISLDELWEEITYDADDFFVQYGLDTQRDNVKLTPVMGFITGRCYTVSPKVLDIRASTTPNSGYSITLQHYASDLEDPISILPPGYHVHVHYVREPFTEVEVYNGGLVDYLYVNTGEKVDVKLKVDEYIMISEAQDPCSIEANYSANACTTQYVTDAVAESVGCSGPWMKSDLPYCNNFEDMRSLISSYVSTYQNHECESCPRFCRSYLYNAYVTDRQKHYTWKPQNFDWKHNVDPSNLQTQIYIHFNNMMVSVYEERFNYDWNLFLSDLGGSIGFLLGLSVIGLIDIIGNIWINFIRPSIVKRKKDTSVPAFQANIATIISKEELKIDQWKQ
ncbi:acid-sensing ion channel 2 [Vanessa cardui]|uniref:acid-sensing ion channel 2 n=1 Tax=Vanessa cardui TaxID=171605 RepID=UPI001F142429|nr:acid-sensing ion channel 2 [Vanessa cardui]